ncbi:MAG: PHP domain-containing protein [Bacillota bacterium]
MSRIPRMDLHVHSGLSDGHGSHGDIAERGWAVGLEVLAITDHYDPFDPQIGRESAGWLQAILNSRDSIREQKPEEGPLVLVGIERGPIPLPGLSADLDLVIGSVHYLTRPVGATPGDLYNPEYWRTYQDDVLRLALDPQVQVLGHIAGYLPMGPLLLPGSTFEERRAMEREIGARFLSRSWYEEVFRRAVRTGKAIELHCATETPEPDVVRLGLKLGVRFSIGSDAHSLDRVGAVEWALDLLEALGATRDSVFFPQLKA